MARSRILKPEFWNDEKLAQVSREVRLTFAGLWTCSDDYGVTKGHPAWLKAQIVPYDSDLTLTQFQHWLADLERIGARGYFILEMLRRNCIVKRGIAGLDSDAEEEPQLRRWLSDHPARQGMSEERKAALRQRAQAGRFWEKR